MVSDGLRAVLREFDARLEAMLGPIHPVRVEIRKMLDRPEVEDGAGCGGMRDWDRPE